MFCSDTEKLVTDLIASRQIDPKSSDVNVGLDGGQGMLKVGMTITDRNEAEQSGRSLYSSVSY